MPLLASEVAVMSLRTTFILLFLAMAGLLGGVAWLASGLLESQSDLVAAGDRRFASYLLADELRQSSDDLTRMARTYVVTEDENYETWFRDILAIRNGDKTRPAGYGGIYWDLVCAGKSPPALGKGRKAALRTLMLEQGFTREEFAKLQESQRRSDALVKLENAAMNALKGRFEDELGGFTVEGDPSPEMARALSHGTAYHLAKAEIMEPLVEFLQLLDQRTAREVAALESQSSHQATMLSVLALAALGILLLGGFFVRRRVLRPVATVAEQLQVIAEGDGDLTRRVAEGRDDEVGALSHWFNVFVSRVHEVVEQATHATRTVEAAAIQMAGSSREQEAGVVELSRVTSDVSSATAQIVQTAEGLAETMGQVARSA
ncbi:MAG: methyl-accepting chemotaxis protein, partial [Pseudorhodobacter sp.]